MSAIASLNLDATALARLGVLQGTEALLPPRAVLGLGWPELERALPDRGLPRGVVELAALPRLHGKASRATAQRCPESMRGGATTIAIAALCAAHAADEHAWCVWITPSREPNDVPSLYAPALVQAGVDLERLLVVRPSPQALARTAVKAAASGAFALVVLDVPHRNDLGGVRSSSSGARRGAHDAGVHDAGAVVVRKLALAAEENGTTSLLLTSALAPRPVPWPVAMRIEVERRPDALSLRVTKDRRGAGSSAHVVRLLDPTTDPALASAESGSFARAG
ncbi:MAG: recombinase A [Labilithrix sp.]|nr:recombinase A [Labilithrix sp.]MBX3221068.1 recombinase A [Labilithrix sp.]